MRQESDGNDAITENYTIISPSQHSEGPFVKIRAPFPSSPQKRPLSGAQGLVQLLGEASCQHSLPPDWENSSPATSGCC